jgi:cytochrome c oxidase subunit 3
MTAAPRALPRDGAYPAGLITVLVTATMLFAAFTAALLVRRAATDWVPVDLPRIVWINVVVMLAASVAVETGRQAARAGSVPLAMTRMAAALALGVVFLLGQLLAWRALAARGVFLPTSPHASFFYLLSAVHGLHVTGGLGALAWALRRLRRAPRLPVTAAALTHVAIFWHFVGALWLYLLVVLTIL